MTAGLAQGIVSLLERHPGRKAKELAELLGVDRAEVNAALYGELRNQVRQDTQYRWFPSKGESRAQALPTTPVPRTALAKLCRYYLECLSRDDQGGVSLFAASKYGQPDYAELRSIPLNGNWEADGDARVRSLIAKVRHDKSRLALTVGYPVKVTRIRSRRTDWEGYMVEPLMLFASPDSSGPAGATRPADFSAPQFNPKAIRSLTGTEGPAVLEEIVGLSEELGLGAGRVQTGYIGNRIDREHG